MMHDRLRVKYLLVLALAACGVDDPGTGPDPDRITAVTVVPSAATVEVGRSVQVRAEVTDGAGRVAAADSATAWSSSDTTRARVSSTGVVTGLAAGPVTISATAAGRTGQAKLEVTPSTRKGPEFSSLSAGASHACALTIDGTAYCWGDNRAGQLGTGATATWSAATPVAGGHRFRSISAGPSFTCAVATDAAAYCWGVGYFGSPSLGESSTTPRLVPGGLSWRAISAGDLFACGLTTSGTAYCWGLNSHGQLGSPRAVCAERKGVVTYCTPAPTRVMGDLAFAALDVGYLHACGITTDGETYCWGRGTLGDGSTEQSEAPVKVAGGHRFVGIDAGESITCGWTAGGEAYCWGFLVGDGAQGGSRTPLRVPGLPRVAAVSGGGSGTTCSLTREGLGYCWGNNNYGQLGDGSRTHRFSPTAMQGGLAFRAISQGYQFGCGATMAGELYCWGVNQAGQLATEVPLERCRQFADNDAFNDPCSPAPVPVAVTRSEA